MTSTETSLPPHVNAIALTRSEHHQMDDQELEQRASGGDQEAAAAYLGRHLRMLSAMSRRLSMNVIEPEDLLAEAIANLFQRWKRGDGPHEQVRAYLITSMRNRVTDELRSPRSRTYSFDPTLPNDAVDRDSEAGGSHDAMDLYQEFDWVRQALARLSAEHQQYIVGTVVEGRKAGDLAVETHRSSAAAYTVNHRAKVALRRAMLQVMLEENADEACGNASRDLPPTVGDGPFDTPEGTSKAHHTSLSHIRSCDRCSRIWSRFSAIGIALGIAPLAVAANVLGVTAPVTGASAADSASSRSSTPHPRSDRTLSRSWPIVTASVLASTMIAAGIAVTTSYIQESGSSDLSGHFSSATEYAGRSVKIVLSLDIDGESIRDVTIHLALPEGARATLGKEWVCDQAAPLACSSDSASWPTPITVTASRGDLQGETWACELDGTLESGVRFDGRISGIFPRPAVGSDAGSSNTR